MIDRAMETFDFKNPDYVPVIKKRIQRLTKLREEPDSLPILKAFYRENPARFIDDWGVTYDPRRVRYDVPAKLPFVLMPKQYEFIDWVLGLWKQGKPGICEKSREVGVSWLAVSLASTLCLFHEGLAIGFGSRKEEYVDKSGSPNALFWKARMFIQNLPIEFRGKWNVDKHSPHMRISFPETDSVITGEAGDNIGRGGRVAMEFIDESAHLARPELIEASLASTTDCRIDLSSVNGTGNPFEIKRHSFPADQVFTFHWRDDLRKDEAWYKKICAEILDPAIIAQELDISYTSSVSGIVIPQEWVQAAIDAHVKLGITISGERSGGLDVADEGPDLNAFAGRYGILLEFNEEWSGAGSDIYQTVERAVGICVSERYSMFRYDADGLGAGVRGDARIIQRDNKNAQGLEIKPYQGSGAVVNPDAPIPMVEHELTKDKQLRTNKDYFKNAKAQAWFELRMRFLRTYRAVQNGTATNPDNLISISSTIPNLNKLAQEFSRATYSKDGTGKILVNKNPDGTRSPNRADAVVIAYAPEEIKRTGFFG